MVASSVMRRFEGAHKRRDRQIAPVTLSALDQAYRTGRTTFPSRVFDPSEVARVLKDGHQSRKIGKFVTKGARRGWPLFTLTLEERATCPRSCRAWSFCMGNSMHAAERIVAGPELEAALWSELSTLQTQHPAGFMVRLHVLGDFYSLDYVRFWTSALATFPGLHVFGFTARLPGTEIGDALWALTEENWGRFAIRFSGLDSPEKASNIQGDNGQDAPDSIESIHCPAQSRQNLTCGSCALCWHSRRSISFAKH